MVGVIWGFLYFPLSFTVDLKPLYEIKSSKYKSENKTSSVCSASPSHESFQQVLG